MLEEFMGTVQEDGLAQLDNTHYNPSDLSNWLESMITELNQPPDFEPVMAAPPPPHPPFNRLIGPAVIDDSFLVAPAESSTITSIDFADPSVKSLSPRTHFEDCSSSTNNYDLKAIPGKAMFSPTQYDSCSPREAKRPRTDYYAANTNTNISTNTNTSANSSNNNNSNSNSISSLQSIPQLPAESTHPVVVVDSQENGVLLVHGLMACAEAVQQNNLSVANALVTQIRELREAKLKPLETGSNVSIGVLAADATLIAGFYQKKLQSQGFEVLVPDKATMEHVVIPAIEALKRRYMEGTRNLLRIAVQVLLVRGVNIVIIASDELQGVLPRYDPLLKKCIDPMDALARSTVKWAKATGNGG